jgi:hypothetical protein
MNTCLQPECAGACNLGHLEAQKFLASLDSGGREFVFCPCLSQEWLGTGWHPPSLQALACACWGKDPLGAGQVMSTP